MRALAFLASLALACGQVLVDVPDFFHYVNRTVIQHEKSCNGVSVKRWPAMGTPPHIRTINPPQMTSLTIPKNRQFPPKDGAYWLKQQAYYIVAGGTVNFTYDNGTEVELITGDLFYSPLGVKHGPIKNGLDEDAVLTVLGDVTPEFGPTPALIPGSLDPNEKVNGGQYSFLPRSWGPTGVSAFPDCINISVHVRNGQPGAISAKLTPNCSIGLHYHPTGVLYFYTQGETIIYGDLDKPVTFPPGTARFAKPGFSYGPEDAGPTETRFMVLGLAGVGGYPPPTETIATRDVDPEPIQALYENNQREEGYAQWGDYIDSVL